MEIYHRSSDAHCSFENVSSTFSRHSCHAITNNTLAKSRRIMIICFFFLLLPPSFFLCWRRCDVALEVRRVKLDNVRTREMQTRKNSIGYGMAEMMAVVLMVAEVLHARQRSKRWYVIIMRWAERCLVWVHASVKYTTCVWAVFVFNEEMAKPKYETDDSSFRSPTTTAARKMTTQKWHS